jgi:hypothetical protein
MPHLVHLMMMPSYAGYQSVINTYISERDKVNDARDKLNKKDFPHTASTLSL